METHIPKEFDEFIDRQIASGKFRSEEEILVRALRDLREREEREDAVREALQVGIDQLDRGDGIEVNTQEEHRAFFEALESAVTRRLRRDDRQGR